MTDDETKAHVVTVLNAAADDAKAKASLAALIADVIGSLRSIANALNTRG